MGEFNLPSGMSAKDIPGNAPAPGQNEAEAIYTLFASGKFDNMLNAYTAWSYREQTRSRRIGEPVYTADHQDVALYLLSLWVQP